MLAVLIMAILLALCVGAIVLMWFDVWPAKKPTGDLDNRFRMIDNQFRWMQILLNCAFLLVVVIAAVLNGMRPVS